MTASLKPKRGEIWQINLGAQAVGEHLVVVIGLDDLAALDVRTCVPIIVYEPHHEDQKWLFTIEPDKLNCLANKSSATTNRVGPVSQDRFVSKLGRVDADVLEEIVALVAISIGFSGY